MIYYNFPYRGAVEYEKTILNAFPLHNEAQRKGKSIHDAMIDIEKSVDEELNKERIELERITCYLKR